MVGVLWGGKCVHWGDSTAVLRDIGVTLCHRDLLMQCSTR